MRCVEGGDGREDSVLMGDLQRSLVAIGAPTGGPKSGTLTGTVDPTLTASLTNGLYVGSRNSRLSKRRLGKSADGMCTATSK